jgi:Streptomyces sporulation and cell division protein, SsgA
MLRSRATTSRTLPAVRLQQRGPSSDWVTLRYRSSDPYAVEAQLLSGRRGADTWRFARDLLAAGLMQSVGEGDVRISPWLAAATGRDAVRLAMRSPETAVHVQLDAADVVEFLELTQTVVRLGNESAHLDLDAALKTLVA